MPDPILHRLVKCCLTCLVIIIALLCYAIGNATRSHSFETDVRETLRLLLDPNAPAISDEDRQRVRDMLFPELKRH